jgi:hypothetical protein
LISWIYISRNFNHERRIFVNKINKDNIYSVQYMQINCENYLKTRMHLYSYLWTIFLLLFGTVPIGWYFVFGCIISLHRIWLLKDIAIKMDKLLFVCTTVLYEYMNSVRHDVCNMFVYTLVWIKIYREFYHCIIYITNERRHVRIVLISLLY